MIRFYSSFWILIVAFWLICLLGKRTSNRCHRLGVCLQEISLLIPTPTYSFKENSQIFRKLCRQAVSFCKHSCSGVFCLRDYHLKNFFFYYFESTTSTLLNVSWLKIPNKFMKILVFEKLSFISIIVIFFSCFFKQKTIKIDFSFRLPFFFLYSWCVGKRNCIPF